MARKSTMHAKVFADIDSQTQDSFPGWFHSGPVLAKIRRVDLYVSTKVEAGLAIDDVINEDKFASIQRYLLAMHREGYLGRHGSTIPPHLFSINFPTTQLTYTWIPKCSCTSVKRLLAGFEPVSLQKKIHQIKFHNSLQALLGQTFAQFANGHWLRRVALIRDPYQRMISCYIDKFAIPTSDKRGFELFAQGHIKNCIGLLGLERDPSHSISFKEFLQYIETTPKLMHDAHWLSQQSFLPQDKNLIQVLPSNRIDLFSQLLGLGSEELQVPLENSRGSSVSMKPERLESPEGSYWDTIPNQIPAECFGAYNLFLGRTSREIINRLYSEDCQLWDSMSSATL